MKTSKFAATLAALLVLGCGPNIDLSERPLFANGNNTFTFLLFDAITGAPVTTATVELQIGGYTLTAEQQGTTNSYVVTRVPNGTHFARFAGGAGFHEMNATVPDNGCTISAGSVTPTNQCFRTWQVALYPSTAVTEDVTIRVFDQETGQPVTTGSVAVTLTSVGNFGATFTNPLNPTPSLRPTVINGAIDSSGTVTIPANQLILFGTYAVDVFGTADSTGEPLVAANNGTSFVAGSTFQDVTLFLNNPELPGSGLPQALSSNVEGAAINTVRPSLQITFPYEVVLCDQTRSGRWTWSWSGTDNGNGLFASPPADPTQAVEALTSTSGGNTTLSLRPLYATQVDSADGVQFAVFANTIQIRVVGTDQCWPLPFVEYRNTDTYVNPRIRIN